MTVRKIKRRKKDGEGDLAILHPERELTVAGRKITMREYGFLEGLRLAGAWGPVVSALAAGEGSSADGFGYAALQTVFAQHADAVLDMMAQACDQPREWLAGLGDEEGQTVQMVWWAVNGPFFVRRVLLELQTRIATGSTSGISTAPSAPATATTSRPSDGSHAAS